MNCSPNHKGLVQGQRRNICSIISDSALQIGHSGVGAICFLNKQGCFSGEEILRGSPKEMFQFCRESVVPNNVPKVIRDGVGGGWVSVCGRSLTDKSSVA